MQTQKFLLPFLFAFTLLTCLQAQTGKIHGVITDKAANEPLIGATVAVAGTATGTVTDLDGLYELELEPGTYALDISYVGYQVEQLTELVIKAGENQKLDFQLGEQSELLATVVVTAEAKRSSYANLLLLQQKSVAAVTGISSEQMKLAPDRSTGDVLKRVAGASVQEGKFVVIRGLSDRYNAALINGLSLPSSEPDKRAFSFDVFPSNLLDNLIIYKTATPDLPGEFAGGVILLNTKEIPQVGFANLTLSTGFNTQSTFKGFKTYEGGKTDWLGYDDGTRELPGSLNNVIRDTFNSSTANQVKYGQTFPNDWAVKDESSLRPSTALQFSAGKSFGKLGLVGALTYSNTPRVVTGERGDFNNDGRKYRYFDNTTKTNYSTGGLLNMAYKLSSRSKIQLNNTYTISGDDQAGYRTGTDLEAGREVNAYSYFFTSNRLHTSQLLGEHAIGERQVKLAWGLGYNRIQRDVPSYRRVWYYKNTEAPAEDPFVASIQPGNPSVNQAGNFYSDQDEKFYTGKLDLTVPYALGGKKGSVKFGGLWEDKDREFDARVYGYIVGHKAQGAQELKILPVGEIFDPKNLSPEGLMVKDATDNSDSYDAASRLLAGYGMVEQHFGERLRAIAGARVESYEQEIHSFRVRSSTRVDTTVTITDVLPSLHLIYALSEKTNLRAAVSKTVARPNFREIAPFTFYDFFVERGLAGEPTLAPTEILNADLRFETYPGENQYFAAAVFYKKFKNSIEQVQIVGTTNLLTWANAPEATNYGLEIEGRWRLGKLAAALADFTVFGNFSYIQSDVDISNLAGQIERTLYGQSPFLLNGGLNYSNPDWGFTSTVLFNRIGRRVWLVGVQDEPHVWEAPRSVFDLQFTKKVSRAGELKLTFGDILNQEARFYQDFDDNGKFDEDSDGLIIANKFGTNVTLGFSYTFSKE